MPVYRWGCTVGTRVSCFGKCARSVRDALVRQWRSRRPSRNIDKRGQAFQCGDGNGRDLVRRCDVDAATATVGASTTAMRSHAASSRRRVGAGASLASRLVIICISHSCRHRYPVTRSCISHRRLRYPGICTTASLSINQHASSPSISRRLAAGGLGIPSSSHLGSESLRSGDSAIIR